MIVHDVTQGENDWFMVRLGIPTASQANRILTAKTWKPSASQEKYRFELLAEWLNGAPLEDGSSGFMERGTDMEDEARRWYEFDQGVEVRQVGFLTLDDGTFGQSPDGIVGEIGTGQLEIKCPAIHTHVRYMLGGEPDYFGQCQSQMYVTGGEWVDMLSYHPDLPPKINRIVRNEDYISKLAEALGPFVKQLESDKLLLAEHRIERPWMMEGIR